MFKSCMRLCCSLTGLFVLTGVQVTSAFNWISDYALSDNASVTTCGGHNVTLHWRYHRTQAEHVNDIEWHFIPDGGHADTMLAARVKGQFLPEPGNRIHVEYVPNAGIRLVNVSMQDSGTYSVRVTDNLHGSLETHIITAHVQVTANADVIENGHLVASVQPGATFSNKTNDYHIMLACSKINPQWRATTEIQWTIPDNRVLPTTLWEDGVSYLAVQNPIQSGVYTCSLQSSSPVVSCIPTNSPVLTGANVTVDGMATRLSLLEAQLLGMKSMETDLESKLQALETENQDLKHKLELVTKSVSFDVSFQSMTTSSHPLHFNDIELNEGGAFDVPSGKFVVPVNGTYVFHMTLVSSNPGSDSSNTMVYLVVDGVKLVNAKTSRVTGYYNTGSVDMVKRLYQGQRVWVINDSDGQRHFTFSVHFSELATTSVGFSVHVNTSNYSNKPLIFTDLISNEGDAFNMTSGTFEVPISGIYKFHMTVTTTNPIQDSSIDSVYLIIDGHPDAVAVSGRPSGYYDTGNVDIIKRLRQGQQLSVHNASRGWHSLPYSLYFSGALLRAEI